MDWPAEPVDLATAARLFREAGHAVDRSRLSRFVSSRNFAHMLDGRRVLVDAASLFEAFRDDFTRQTMAGQTSPPPTMPETRRSSDPKREETELKVQERRLDLAIRLRQLVPVEEVLAAQAEAIAAFRASAAQTRADDADRMLHDLHLPADRIGELRNALKRRDFHLQEVFAASLAHLTVAADDPEDSARVRLDQLVALALELRGEPEAGSSLIES